MSKFFFILNGSNDLYYSINNSIRDLLNKVAYIEKQEVYIFYSLINCDVCNLWKGAAKEQSYVNEIGALKILNGIVSKIEYKQFFREVCYEGNNVKLMAPDLFLNRYLKDEDINIVILSGHGGPFQSFLDMSIWPPQSLNTVKLCKRIKKNKIDVLLLDMCAMNYIEVIYELLYNSMIKNIITYKNLAPFYGVNYYNLICHFSKIDDLDIDISNYLKKQKSPLIFVSKERINYIEKIKKINSDLVKHCIKEKYPNFDVQINEFKNLFHKVAIENDSALKIPTQSINYIKFYLENSDERCLYSQYSYAHGNLWQYFITNNYKEDLSYNRESINLDDESIKNIVWIHNNYLSNERLNEYVIELKRKWKKGEVEF